MGVASSTMVLGRSLRRGEPTGNGLIMWLFTIMGSSFFGDLERALSGAGGGMLEVLEEFKGRGRFDIDSLVRIRGAPDGVRVGLDAQKSRRPMLFVRGG